jgi:hypothetical protein
MHTHFRVRPPAALFLFVLTAIEMLCMVDLPIAYDRPMVSILNFVVGLAIGIWVLVRRDQPAPAQGDGWPRWILWASAILLGWVTVHNSRILFGHVAVDYKISDVIPIMDVMARRWLHGEAVYAIIPEIWDGMQPIYLPTMWLPYVTSVLGGFDPRWVVMAGTLVAVWVPMLWLPRGHRYTRWSLLVIPAVALLFRQFLDLDTRYVTMCDEGVVVAWYSLLAWALWRGEPILIGLMITMSILSRLSIIGWLPAYMAWVFFFENRQKAYKIALAGGISGIILLVVTQALWSWQVFAALPGRYMEAVMGPDFEKLQGAIQEGLGIAKMLPQSAFPTLDVANKIGTFGAPIVLVLIYARWRDRFDRRWFPIGMLKIGLVCFFNLLIIPIHTMFYVSAFLSVAILAMYTQDRPDAA